MSPKIYKLRGAYGARSKRQKRRWRQYGLMHWKRRKRGLMNLYYKTGYKNAYKY